MNLKDVFENINWVSMEVWAKDNFMLMFMTRYDESCDLWFWFDDYPWEFSAFCNLE